MRAIMARTPLIKEITNSRLLKEYASWIYCSACNETIAYLCYVTYDKFEFLYTCKCGNKGKIYIEFDNIESRSESNELLVKIKNRLCCPKDKSPLVTFLDDKMINYNSKILCKCCSVEYKVSKKNI